MMEVYVDTHNVYYNFNQHKKKASDEQTHKEVKKQLPLNFKKQLDSKELEDLYGNQNSAHLNQSIINQMAKVNPKEPFHFEDEPTLNEEKKH